VRLSSPFESLTSRAHTSVAPSSSSRRHREFPKTPPTESLTQSPSFHLWGRLRAIKTGPPHPPLHIGLQIVASIIPWWPCPKHRPSRPPLQAARILQFILGLGFALGEFALNYLPAGALRSRVHVP
jgi:hypothetical protein